MAAPRSKNPIIALLVALAGLAVAVFVGTQGGGDDKASASASSTVSVTSTVTSRTPGATAPRATTTTTTTANTVVDPASAIPQPAWATLAAIDAGRWPPSDAPGTEGGRTFGNHEGRLPATAGGQRVRYQEWDVNRKQSGRGRDAQRIVTGSDGSAWYTDDHYETFARMR